MTTTAQQVLDEIRKTHDTTQLSTDMFSNLCQAVTFYLRGGFSVADCARLASEEIFQAAR